MKNMNRLKENDLILITGAAGGIGEAAVKKLIFEGAKVIGISRNEAKLKEIKNGLKDPEKFEYEIMDLSENIPEISGKIVEISEKYGKFSGFVHAAGVLNIMPVSIWDYNSAVKDFNVNLFSAIEIIKALQKKKCRQELLNIVFVSSIAAKIGNAGALNYSLAKSALNNLTITLSKELNTKKIRINSVMPGAIETDMAKKYNDNVSYDYLLTSSKKTMFGEIGQPEYIADLISFLLSKESYWIQGANITIDGGETL